MKRTFPLVVLVMLPLAAFFVYAPGFSGDFLFDDWANLPAIGSYGRVDNWDAFWRYITSGTADPTGRPVALLSFLIDATDWPAEAWRFKYTSTLMHVLNGMLLVWLLLRLGRLLGLNEPEARWSALLGGSLWLFHPLWVSTTLYVVQRQALLVATWVLLAMLGYVAGRLWISQGRRGGMLLISLSVAGGTLLAVLSKGNGALLPLFVLLLETVILLPTLGRPGFTYWKAWKWLFLAVPSLAVLGYLAGSMYDSGEAYRAFRDFTLQERVFTEGRVLWDYLRVLFLPAPYTSGLFHDNYPVSTSLFHPWTTGLAWAGLVMLGTTAWFLRSRHPVFSFSVLFFLAGHLLESTVVPLELYFEHRNYVPALFLFWPLAVGVVRMPFIATKWKAVASTGIVALLALFTWMRADLWGSPQEQVEIWARLNPESPRAQTMAALYDIRNARYARAQRRLEKILERKPDSAQAALNLISARCGRGGVRKGDLERARFALANNKAAKGVLVGWMEKVIRQYGKGSGCAGLDSASLFLLLDAAASNPALQSPGSQQDIYHLKGLLALEGGKKDMALAFFERAMELEPRPGVVLSEAALLGSHGVPEMGMALLEKGRKIWIGSRRPNWSMAYIHSLLLESQGYWENEYAYLKKVMLEDIR